VLIVTWLHDVPTATDYVLRSSDYGVICPRVLTLGDSMVQWLAPWLATQEIMDLTLGLRIATVG